MVQDILAGRQPALSADLPAGLLIELMYEVKHRGQLQIAGLVLIAVDCMNTLKERGQPHGVKVHDECG